MAILLYLANMTIRLAFAITLSSLLAFAFACGGGGEYVENAPLENVTAPAASWPENFVTGPGNGPALYLDASAASPALGYVSEGVAVRVEGAPENGRVLARIMGPMKVKAYIDASRLGYRVQRRGKVRGTPTYVGPNDIVRYLGAEDGTRTRVEVTPMIGDVPLGTFQGSFPTVGLSPDAPSADAEAPRAGETRRVPAGQSVPVYDRPDGQIVATIPSTENGTNVTVLRDQNPWFGIRVGDGPYIVGFVNVPLGNGIGTAGGGTAPSAVPARIEAESAHPLWRVPARTRVKFNDRTVGILAEDGYAREMNRYADSDEVDVFIAVDDDVALRGMVPTAALQPVE